jgi:hypothetical protein
MDSLTSRFVRSSICRIFFRISRGIINSLRIGLVKSRLFAVGGYGTGSSSKIF